MVVTVAPTRPGPAEPTVIATHTAVPAFTLEQAAVKRTLGELWPLPPERRHAALALFDHTMVERRYSVLPMEALRTRRRLSETIAIYRDHAIRLGREVAARCLAAADVPPRAVDLIITLSCTGFMIPSLDAYLFNELGLRPDVRRLPITELGCSAGAAALGRARDFLVGHPDAHVLIVSVELPTLSFQHEDTRPAQMVSTALFGDGAAAALLRGRAGAGVSILQSRSHIFPRSEDALGFDLRDDGFHVLLAREIPELLRDKLSAIVDDLVAAAGLARQDLTTFVLHPGGRRILVALEEALGVDRADTGPSWEVLRRYGNLSSAAILFVLDRWLRDRLPRPGTHGLLGAFGPGLSAELCLLRWNSP